MTTQFPVKKKSEKFSERMAKKTKLSEAEIDRLVHIFRQITVSSVVRYSPEGRFQDSRHASNKMNRKTFRAFLNENFGMTDDVIMDRLFKHFNRLSCDDIDAEEWIYGFSVFLRGTSMNEFQFLNEHSRIFGGVG